MTLTQERFDALVVPHLGCMLRRAYSLLGSHDLAWDAVQKTLLQLWRGGRVPDEPRQVLLSLVHPVSLGIRRSRQRRQRHETSASERWTEESNCGDPVCEAQVRELQSQLANAMDSLPSECRDVFLARFVQGRAYSEIANGLDLPIGTVRSRLHRARQLLAEQLESNDLVQSSIA